MLQFLRTLFLCSFSFLGLISCKSFELSKVQKTNKEIQPVDNLYFNSKKTDYLYKSQIDIYGNHLSGILIIKKINDDFHRVVLTSDFGNKLFDFEISEKEFKLNYIIPDMDKRIVKRFLEKDFRILLKRNFNVNESFENEKENIYQSNQNEKNYFLFFNKDEKNLTKIIYTENNREKINFTFTAKNPIFADEIEVNHKDFNINIKLFQITENN